MPAADDFEKKSQAFLDWFNDQPGTYFHPDLKIADLRDRNAGRGIVATKRIEADTDLFTIPRNIVMTKENSNLRINDPVDFDRYDEIPDLEEENAEWLKLVITLIYEDFCRDSALWKPYLDVLPEKFDTLMFWNEDELEELQGSAVRQKIGKAEADKMFRAQLLPFLNKHQYVFFRCGRSKPNDEELLAKAHRMSSAIMAYAFDLEKDEDEDDEGEDGWVEYREGKTLGMVPMADMLNADAEFNAHLSHGDESLTMTSLRPIEAGEEVLNYYGPLPNSDLLRRYGYTSSKHEAHDVVELSWENVVAATKSQLDVSDEDIQKAIARLDEVYEEELENSFVLEREPVEPSSEGLLPKTRTKVKTLPAELATQTAAILNSLLKTKPSLEIDEHNSLWEIVRSAIAGRLAEYPTSILEDEKLLETATGRQRMAVMVRLGEKQILQEAIDSIPRNLERHSNRNGEPIAKRQRTE
jgi:SET domain-containing protein 6